MKYLLKDNIKLFYTISRKQIKNTYFRVKSAFVLITTNSLTSDAKIIEFLFSKFDYFKGLVDKNASSSLLTTVYGRQIKIVINDVYSKTSYYLEEDVLNIFLNKNDEYDFVLKSILKDLLKNFIEQYSEVIKETIKIYNLNLVPIKYKYLVSKFGSCHIKKHEITLNTFLIALPIETIFYVIYHEYAHLVEPSHSKKFYRVLVRMAPNCFKAKKYLKGVLIPKKFKRNDLVVV